MCVNIFLKQRCIAFSVGECSSGGNSTLKSRVLIDRAGSGFVQGTCETCHRVLGELDQKGAQSSEISCSPFPNLVCAALPASAPCGETAAVLQDQE